MPPGTTRGPTTKSALLLLLFVLLGTRPEAALGFGKYLQQKSLAKEGEEGGAEVLLADRQQVTRDRPSEAAATVAKAH